MLECGPSMYLFGRESIQKADALIASFPLMIALRLSATPPAPRSIRIKRRQIASRLALRELNFATGFADLNLSQSLLEVLAWLSTIPARRPSCSSAAAWTAHPQYGDAFSQEYQRERRPRPCRFHFQAIDAISKTSQRTRQERASSRIGADAQTGEATLRILRPRLEDASISPNLSRTSKGLTPKSRKWCATNTVLRSSRRRPTENSTPSPSPRTTHFA